MKAKKVHNCDLLFGGISLPTFIQLFFIPIANMKKYWRGEKMYQETETQVVDTLPECESQEQDPANEQVCQKKPPSEINT